MKFLPSSKNSNEGNVLSVAMFSTAAVGFVLASYLTLVNSVNYSSARSQSWNTSISVVEAGIEEALTHLNVNGVTNLNRDGWYGSGNWYFKTAYLHDGTGSRYDAFIYVQNNPIIYSRGWVPVPENNVRHYGFAAIGVPSSQPMVGRMVKVTTSSDGLFVKGMVARETIDMNGNNVETDSFDSTNPSYSTNGRYDATKRKDHGDVASNSSIINSVSVGNANIHGRVATGPGGSVAVGSNGAVGSEAWHTAGNSGIEPGYFTDDMNVSFKDIDPPFNGGALTPGGGTVTTTNYTVTTAEQTSTTFPASPQGPVSTNTQSLTTSTYPDPVPPGGVSTNIQTVWTSSRTYPAAGTYIGGVTTRNVTTGKPANRGTWYDYNAITGYEYTYTAVTYTYWDYTTNYTTSSESYNYVLADGNYHLTGLSMSGHDDMVITGDAVLYVEGNVSLSGQAAIYIVPGASLKLYVSGSSASIQGNGVINETGYAQNFMYFGLPSNTSLTLGGNGEMLAVVYAPNANLSLNGGGSGDTDFVGASVTRTVTMNGHFKFHYDEALSKWGPESKYVITSWDERPTLETN